MSASRVPGDDEIDLATATAIASAVGEEGMDVNMATCSFHKIKWLYLEKEDLSIPIVTQNENGPCPLLALINALCLSRRMRLTPGKMSISGQQLIETLFAYLLENQPQEMTEAQKLNYERNVQDAMAVSRHLLTGLNMNVKMSRVDQFEYTPEMIIFDLVGVNLYHGWLVEPGSSIHSDLLATLTYNTMVEKAIAATEDLPMDATEAQQEAWTEQRSIGTAAKDFLDQSASQLTVHGLLELKRALTDGQTSVFFRNNHFSTLYKQNGNLYVLVTDQGYFDEHQVVFESLNDVHGSSAFYDHNLTEVTAALQNRAKEAAAAQSSNQGSVGATAAVAPSSVGAATTGLASTQEDQDYLLALTLRDEESAAAARGQAAGSGTAAATSSNTVAVSLPTAHGVPPAEVPRQEAAATCRPVQESSGLIPVSVSRPSTQAHQAVANVPAATDGGLPAADHAAPCPVLTADQLTSAIAMATAAIQPTQSQSGPTQPTQEDLDMQVARELQAALDQDVAMELHRQEETLRLQEEEVQLRQTQPSTAQVSELQQQQQQQQQDQQVAQQVEQEQQAEQQQ
eukprot:scpid71386/ scgid25784/ Protein FAM63A